VGTGSEHKAGVLEGNMNTIIMMRVKGKDTAELLVNQLSKTTIDRLTRVTSANDSADIDNKVHFTSKNEDRITTETADLITVDHVMQLPKGQAFMLTKGSELYKVRFPLINDKADNIQIPEHVDEMCEELKQRYQTSDEWWNFAPSHDSLAPDIDLSDVDLSKFGDISELGNISDLFDTEEAVQLEAA